MLTTWYMCLTSHLKIRFQLLINFYSPIAITREAENLSGINNRQGISRSHFVVHFPSNTEFPFTLLHSSPSEEWVENLAHKLIVIISIQSSTPTSTPTPHPPLPSPPTHTEPWGQCLPFKDTFPSGGVNTSLPGTSTQTVSPSVNIGMGLEQMVQYT